MAFPIFIYCCTGRYCTTESYPHVTALLDNTTSLGFSSQHPTKQRKLLGCRTVTWEHTTAKAPRAWTEATAPIFEPAWGSAMVTGLACFTHLHCNWGCKWREAAGSTAAVPMKHEMPSVLPGRATGTEHEVPEQRAAVPPALPTSADFAALPLEAKCPGIKLPRVCLPALLSAS